MFMEVLRLNSGFEQLIIDYPNVHDCMEDAEGCMIAWTIQIIVFLTLNALHSFIDSLK